MKKINLLMLVSIGLSIIFSEILAAGELKKAKHITVSESVVMAKHDYGCNITCISTDDGLFFVDTGLNTELARQFREDMEKKFSKKTCALLITHVHTDHFFGMGAFSDVNVISSEVGKNSWRKQLAIEFTEKRIEAYDRIFSGFKESFPSAKPFIPTVFFRDKIILGEGKNQLIFTTTGGHTACSSSVFFPAQGVLVSGDLVQVDQYPYFGDPTNDMNAWLAAFKKWETMPIKKVCPGHGRPVNKSYITLMKNYFEKLISVLKKLKSRNLEAKVVIRHSELPEGYWGQEAKRPVWFDYCIASLYKSL
jgi:glyoxylase-like metal-dependent hydrolase (beta-lactamase superfamily II)